MTTNTASFRYQNNNGRESLVVTGTQTRTVASAHPNFTKIRDYCLKQQDAGAALDADYLFELINVGKTITDKLVNVTKRVSYKGGKLYFDGDQVEDALAKHILRMIKEGDTQYEAWALFLENLSQNPRKSSRKSLFDWIADRNLTITPEGEFIAYKGVSAEGRSLQAGRGTVTDKHGNVTEYTSDKLPNEVGSTVEVPRSYVAEDRDVACSYGLHVGTRSYATSYGTRMLIVAVNPRDVVMVPKDGNGQKVRVCRYRVVDDNEAELTETTYVGKRRAEESVEEDLADPTDYEGCVCCGDDADSGEEYCQNCQDVGCDGSDDPDDEEEDF